MRGRRWHVPGLLGTRGCRNGVGGSASPPALPQEGFAAWAGSAGSITQSPPFQKEVVLCTHTCHNLSELR